MDIKAIVRLVLGLLFWCVTVLAAFWVTIGITFAGAEGGKFVWDSLLPWCWDVHLPLVIWAPYALLIFVGAMALTMIALIVGLVGAGYCLVFTVNGRVAGFLLGRIWPE